MHKIHRTSTGIAVKVSTLKPARLEIDTVEWRDKTYGNTYRSACATLYSATRKPIAYAAIQFGYGYSGAVHEIVDLLTSAGALPQGYHTTLTQGISESVTPALKRTATEHGRAAYNTLDRGGRL